MHRPMKKKLVTTNGHCIRFLTITLVVMVNLSASIGRNWNHHDHKNGEIKWAPNCDFPEGHVIKKAKDVTQEECGSRCLDHPRCTHFSFMGDKCVLKEIESEVKVTNDGGVSRCGFVSRRVSRPILVSIFFKDNFSTSKRWLSNIVKFIIFRE